MLGAQKLFIFALIFGIGGCKEIEAETTPTDSLESDEDTTDLATDDSPPQDLYVIKTIVYEIGILTDASNDTDSQNQTFDQVDFTYYDPNNTATDIDLSNLPIPIQTNVSGVTVTGLIPGSDLAAILMPPNRDNNTLPHIVLPTKQVTVTHNISTSNPDTGAEIISKLPAILGFPVKKKEESTTEKAEDKDE